VLASIKFIAALESLNTVRIILLGPSLTTTFYTDAVKRFVNARQRRGVCSDVSRRLQTRFGHICSALQKSLSGGRPGVTGGRGVTPRGVAALPGPPGAAGCRWLRTHHSFRLRPTRPSAVSNSTHSQKKTTEAIPTRH
jgi:hypothetical protein